MKRFLSGLILAAIVMSLVSCGSSRRGVGCPNNPMNYRYR